MAKTLDEILKAGRLDPAAIREMQEKAKKAGLTKKIIHIELDLLTGNLKHDTSPMDNVMLLGMLEFYKVIAIGNMLGRPIAAKDEPAPEPETPAAEPSTPVDVGPSADAPSTEIPPAPAAPAAAADVPAPAAEGAPAA